MEISRIDVSSEYRIDRNDLKKSLRIYQKKKPGFQEKTREPLAPLGPISAPRYTQGADGIYRRSSEEKEGTATLLFTGDLMCQSLQMEEALEKHGCYDFRDSFDYVKDIFHDADFVAGNMETCLSESAPYSDEIAYVEEKPHLNAPSTFLDALNYAGYDMLITANNHACDCGLVGLYETYAHLEQYRFIHTGAFLSRNEPHHKIVEINGIKVGFFALASWYNHKNEKIFRWGRRVFLNGYTLGKVKKAVSQLKAEGAEYIIAFPHWGSEYIHEFDEHQPVRCYELANSGVDYIIGSHPHVIQKFDILETADGRRVPIIYSMGNFLSHMVGDDIRDSLILRITLKRNADGKVELEENGYIPCRIFASRKKCLCYNRPLTSPFSTIRSEAAKESYERIRQAIGDMIEPIVELNK